MLTLLSGPVDTTTPDDRVSHCGPLRTLSSHWRTLQVVQNKKTGVFVCLLFEHCKTRLNFISSEAVHWTTK